MSNSVNKISVVLATHNGERFIEKQLDSLSQQTLPPFELVISDDCSTDRTDQILRSFVIASPFPVHYKRNSQAKGFRENFLSAINMTSGSWLAFCDQDDIWRTDKLETCAKYMTIQGVTQIVHQANLIDQNDTDIGIFAQGIQRTALRNQLSYDLWGTFFGFSMVVDRRIFDVYPADRRFIDFIDTKHLIAHDRWAFFLGQTLGKTFEIGEPLVAYRQHEMNLYGSGSHKVERKSIQSAKVENATYISATSKMLDIVETLPAATEETFPSFDRERAISVYANALRQLRARGAVYTSGRLGALIKITAMCLNGHYRNAQDGKFRWRSILRDLQITMVRNT